MTDNEQKKNEETVATNELLSNMEDITVVQGTDSSAAKAKKKVVKEEAEDGNKVFRKFKIKDIVFLAIMAACMLITGSIMPLVGSIPVFAIVQACLGLQFSIFPTIGMMKVRKPGALLFISLCCGALFAFMFFPMFICWCDIFPDYAPDRKSVDDVVVFYNRQGRQRCVCRGDEPVGGDRNVSGCGGNLHYWRNRRCAYIKRT